MQRRMPYFEILKTPIELLFLATILLGLGNLLINPAMHVVYSIHNDTIVNIGRFLFRLGQYMIVNTPLWFLVRLCGRKSGQAVPVMSGMAAYAAFLIATMVFAPDDLGTNAYSSVLGLSIARTTAGSLTRTTHYPLHMGIIGAIIPALIALYAYAHSKKRHEFGIFSFVTPEFSCLLETVTLCFLLGWGMSYAWPWVLKGINKLVSFIAADTSNPVNLALYGILDRFLAVFNLNSLIEQPFWYTASGGSWLSVAGTSVFGDANIWTAQIEANSLPGAAGRFFTPYYVLNLFAMPGMMWAMFSLITDPLERKRQLPLFIIATICSICFGCLLPLEMMLFVLSPLLFLIHLGLTAVLFGVLDVMRVFIGFSTTNTNIYGAVPGTLPELVSYWSNLHLRTSMVKLLIVGIIALIVYFLITRFYFRKLAIDLFQTGDTDRMVTAVIKAVGGIENIRIVQSTVTTLTVLVSDASLIDVNTLKRLGALRVYETRAGFNIKFGECSTIVRNGIISEIRNTVRNAAV